MTSAGIDAYAQRWDCYWDAVNMASTPPTKKDVLLARYKPGGVHDSSEAVGRRRVETVAVSVHRREETLRAKRLRRDTSLQGLAALGSRGASRASLGAPLGQPPP